MFDVYNLLDIEPVKAEGVYFWDREGNKYLDFYGGMPLFQSATRTRTTWNKCPGS